MRSFFIFVKFSCRKGFTLLEVMVAMAIMGLALAGVMQIFTSTLAGIGKSDLYTEGTLIARQVMEEFLLKSELDEGVYTGDALENFVWEVQVIQRRTPLQDQTTQDSEENSQLPIEWLEDESPLIIYEINVNVTWPNLSYPGRIVLSSLVSKIEQNANSDTNNAK
jgi:prepilin-type N-terminal cleavage/methylation domain-containing protein